MLSREQKRKLVVELAGILKDNGNFVFTDFSGLAMAEMTALKKELKKENIGFKVLKKSLLGLAEAAAEGPPFSEGRSFSSSLANHKGSLALVYGEDGAEPNLMAKLVESFSQAHKKLEILGGYLLGQLMKPREVVALARLPGREVLLAQALAMLMSPITGLARALSQIAKGKGQIANREAGSN